VRKPRPFYYGLFGDILLVSSERGRIVGGIDALLDGNGLHRTRAYEEVRRRLPRAVSKFIYVDTAGLFARAVESGEDEEIPEALRALVQAGTAAGLAVDVRDRAIVFDLASSDNNTDAVLGLLWKSIDASLEQARYQSARMVSVANMRALLIACMNFANDHKKQWPPTINALVESGLLGGRDQAAKLLAQPYAREGKRSRDTFYLYRPVRDIKAVEDPGGMVVFSEPEVYRGGAVFGFLDGHAEWIASPRADELLATMRRDR
jgi:hypothetical protein